MSLAPVDAQEAHFGPLENCKPTLLASGTLLFCNGHMLEFALYLDRVIVNFDRAVPQDVANVLPNENVAAMFQANRRYRLHHAL